jgi:uncharacterized membrane protein
VSGGKRKRRPASGSPSPKKKAPTPATGGQAEPAGARENALDSGAGAAGAAPVVVESTASVPFRGILLVLVGLAFAAFLISFYLTLTHYRDIVPPCYGTSGCEEVITSRYAVILGVPLALIGTVYFALMFYLGIGLLSMPSRRRLLARVYGWLADLGVLAAVVLFLIQAVILKAYCTYCLTTEIIALLLWGASWLVMRRETTEVVDRPVEDGPTG